MIAERLICTLFLSYAYILQSQPLAFLLYLFHFLRFCHFILLSHHIHFHLLRIVHIFHFYTCFSGGSSHSARSCQSPKRRKMFIMEFDQAQVLCVFCSCFSLFSSFPFLFCTFLYPPPPSHSNFVGRFFWLFLLLLHVPVLAWWMSSLFHIYFSQYDTAHTAFQ